MKPPFVQGAGGDASFGGASGAPTGSSPGGTGNNVTPGGGGTSGGTGSPSAPNCPTYDGDFLPSVNAPVCSNCHTGGKLPNWATYSTAKASCTTIGSRVASGSMPPKGSGLTLTAAQRALVADWVRLGCPEAESNLPASCFPAPPQGAGGSNTTPPQGGTGTTPPQGGGGTGTNPPQGAGGATSPAQGSGGAGMNPPTAAVLSITRAEWDSEKESLRLEGSCSDYAATLRADFSGRMEAVANDMGRFRNVFNNVATDPGMITVTASNGVAATSAVTAN
jgi:hypothetical protein